MRIMVTGSSGFLGKHVCSALEDHGHGVVRLDIAKGGMDITKPMAVQMLIDGGVAYFDAVVHMAAIAAPRTCDADPGLAYSVNVNGTHQVIKLAIEAGAKKFVFMSSAHVYGISPRYLPTNEIHPLQPQETYTTTKILGEQLCQLYYENHGLNYTVLRLFNAYGPGQLPGYFIPDKIIQAQNEGKVQLSGGGTTKDFVFVDDVVRAVLLALETSFVGPINIGTGVQTSLNAVAFMIANHLGARFEGIFNDSDNLTRMMADYDRAKKVLGWEPTVNLEEGLKRTIQATVGAIVEPT